MKNIRYIPFEYGDNQLKEQYILAFEKFLTDKQYILGRNVSHFESEWADYCQTKYALGVGNGYDALFITLKALNIKPGDEVIVPAHTFAATALAVLNVGATPVLIDADERTFNIDATLIEDKLTTNTKAIIAVHLYGNPCDMDTILGICNKHNLFLIEDNAQAQGAKYKDKKTGSFGDVSATSFYPIKNLGALGDGGAINTNSKKLLERASLLRNYGSPDKHEMQIQGVNSRLDELQASFLNIKLKYLDEWNAEREKINQWYRKELLHINELQICDQPDHIYSANHIFPVLSERKNDLRTFLKENGIQTLQHYPLPYHLEEAFGSLQYKKGDFPITEKICEQELSLPIFPGLTQEDVQYIGKAMKAFYTN